MAIASPEHGPGEQEISVRVPNCVEVVVDVEQPAGVEVQTTNGCTLSRVYRTRYVDVTCPSAVWLWLVNPTVVALDWVRMLGVD